MNMTKAELRETAQMALKSEYGFAPKKSDIVLLEWFGDGTYIMFSVNGNQYQFHSKIFNNGFVTCGVFVGKGTITKFGE